MWPINPGAVTVRRNPASIVLRLLSCVRMSEVLVLQGSPLLGAFFAMGRLSVARCMAIALLMAGSTLLTAHVFVLNDWSGMSYDLRDPNRRNGVFTGRGIGREAIAFLAFALLVAGLVVLSRFGSPTLTIALAIAGLSALYSFPHVHLKGVPVLSSALHLVGGLLQFLLGYSVFAVPDWRGIQIGGYFALIFAAGHLTHETRDSDSDGRNGIRTNAVTFGNMRSFVGGLVLFTVANLILILLALWTVVPRPLAFVVLVFPLHVYWSVQTIRSGLTFASVQRLRLRYRLLYAATGVWMAAVVFFETLRHGVYPGWS